jgi:hypothetical protein
MHISSKTFLAMTLMVGLFQSMDCLKCYSCDSSTQSACADPANTSGMTSIDCPVAADQFCQVNNSILYILSINLLTNNHFQQCRK